MLEADYLAGLPETLAALYAQAEADILADMARRVSAYDYWIPAAEHQRRALSEMGAVQTDILRELSRRTGRAVTELERLMKEAAEKTLDYDGEIYRAHGLTPTPPGAAPEFKQILAAGMEQTKGLFTNLTRTTANTASGQFEAALDRAWLQISSGAFDYNAAIRTAVKDLARQGVGAIRYPTGHTDTLETAVRRAVVTGVNQTCGKLQLALADEMGCDLMELTAHAGARPEHAAWQGQIVSRSGRRGYLSLSDIGYGTGAGFKGWNCRHDWNPYFEGSPRAYTGETLKRFDEPKYSYNGQRLTEYEAAQRQRGIERNIRRWKRENKAMEAAGLDGSESAAKIRQWQAAQKDFLRQTGLKPQGERAYRAGGILQAKKYPPFEVTMDAAGGKLIEKDRYAIDQYKKSYVSYPLNAALRGGIPLSKAQQAIVHDLDQALLKLPAYKGTVYRSLRSEEMVDADAFLRAHNPGKTVTYPAYTSSSSTVYDEAMDIQMIIQSKQGCDMREYNPLEQEVLFKRSSTFLVEKREGAKIWLTEI